MSKFNTKSLLFILALCLLVSACGNKGALVKPEPQASKAETGR